MRKSYRPAVIPKGGHLRYFNLLTDAEQGRSVRRLVKAGHTHQRVRDLTGLTLEKIRAHVAAQVHWRDE